MLTPLRQTFDRGMMPPASDIEVGIRSSVGDGDFTTAGVSLKLAMNKVMGLNWNPASPPDGPSPNDGSTSRGRVLLELAGVALAYWVAARLSLNLALVGGQVTPIWPPTGIAVVALLVIGRRVWPAITLAAFAVNLPIGPTFPAVCGIAIGNTLAPVVSAELLKRVDLHFELDRLRDAMAMVFLGALTGMLISATVGSLMLVFFGRTPHPPFWSTFAVWWAGDAMGVLLVAPLLLSFLPGVRGPVWNWRRRAELIGLLLMAATLDYFLFQTPLHLLYLAFPPIVYAAWRFRLRGVSLAALIASSMGIWAAVHHAGAFQGEDLVETAVTLQAFNVTVAFSSFVLASFIEAREHRDEMAQLYNQARMTSDAKSSFLNMAAHELRTPLSVILGYLSLLSDGSLGPTPVKWRQPLQILERKAGELNTIVDDLLAAARIEAGTLPQQETALDLRDLIRDAVARARPRAELLGAIIVLAPDDEPVPVSADRSQINRILDNLINNGLTYSLRAPRVAISATATGSRALVRVEDNGIGIPIEARDRVFDRFYRLNDPNLECLPGTGLGLYLSRHMAEAHGGRLVIERSSPGRGTTFALDLPVSSTPRFDPYPPRQA
ncbi:MAG TPA: MASE1 domain-containing protein [Candidatus Dormibacteraeota bacterium]|nr:MASE1 domain-containing protein [Candidatus Dormibacteraeota bacterium]